jgi:ubiquinone biosynthesis protein
LPEIELVWARPARPRNRWPGYVAALLAGGALVWAGTLLGWLG